MKHNGRVIAFTMVLITNLIYITYYFKRDGYVSFLEISGLPILLLISWWCGKQYDKLKYLEVQVQLKTKELQKNSEVFKVIYEYSPIGIALIDENSRPILANKKIQEMLGYTENELCKMTFKDFSFPEESETNIELLNKLVSRKIDHYTLEKRYIRKNGEILWGNVTTTLYPDMENGKTYAIGMVNNITEKKLTEQRLKEAYEEAKLRSKRDGLTEIANRRHFDEYIVTEFQQAVVTSTPLSIIMLDIDYFKQYNDTYGHLQGDEILKKVAKTLENTISWENDLVARYGGEEFVIVLPKTNLKDAEIVAEKVRIAIENLYIPHKGSKIHSHLTVSLGVSTMDEQCIEPTDLINNADHALYEAKKNGSNRVILFEKEKCEV